MLQRWAAWRRLLNGCLIFTQNFLAAFAKPLLCAGRFISTKFNLKNMCSTPWCFGDCEECEADKKYEQEREEASAECPYRKECNWVVIDVKNDRCTTCGESYTYP